MQPLMVPGWNGSGPDHWQTRWQSALGATRVEQENWATPCPDTWTRTLDLYVRSAPGAVILIAHSLGCLTVVKWAQEKRAHSTKVAGAFLVAPPDLEHSYCRDLEIQRFSPVPLVALPFPSMLVASEDDHYASIDGARRLAAAWGSDFVSAGRAGHINPESGHCEWPAGLDLFKAFTRRLAHPESVPPVLIS